MSNAFQGMLFDCVSECLEPVVVGAKSVPRYEVRLVRNESQAYQARKIGGSDDAVALCVELVRSVLDNATAEKFLVVSLDTQLRPIGVHVVTQGVLDASLVHPREVFQHALLTNASSLLLCHNHPSGDLTPSREDKTTTKRLRDAGDILGVKIIDHIIVGNDPMTGDFRGVSMAATCGFIDTLKKWD